MHKHDLWKALKSETPKTVEPVRGVYETRRLCAMPLPHPDSGAWQLVVMVSLKKLVMLACPSSNRDKHNRGQFLFK